MKALSLQQRMAEDLIRQSKGIKEYAEGARSKSVGIESPGKQSFGDLLREEINDVNNSQKDASKKSMELATGKSEGLHETMLALTKAELSFNLMVQVRNKALEAYQEMMRMQV